MTVSDVMDLDEVSAAQSGTTIFQINPSSGQVTRTSGGGRRISNALVRVQVKISCKPEYWGSSRGDCKRDRIGVAIGSFGLSTGRALPLTNFTVSMSSASLFGSTLGSNPIIFLLNPIGDNQTKTFYLGADVPVAGDDSGRSTGTGYAPYYVNITDIYGNLLDQTFSAAQLTAYRALSVTKVSDLQFGTVSRAKTSGTVTIDPITGARTITGGGIGYPTPAWTPAVLTISGEGGQAFSVSVPGNIQLSGPTNLNVQTKTNLPAAPVLSNSIGMPGTFTLKVGGAFPIANGSLTGTYSGVWTVSVDYN